jgi:hypothetical protein
VAQAQQEGIEQTMDRSEAQRLLEEAERMMQLQRETVIVSEVASVLITPVTLGREEELATPENTSMEEYTPQQTSGWTPIGGPGTEPMVFSDVLGQVAPVIADLITIYSDNEEVNTSVPIVNEEVTEVLDMMSQGPKYLGEETELNTIEGDHSTPNWTPQPLDKEGSNIKGHEEPRDKNENGNEASIGRSDAPVKGKDQGNPDVEDSSGGNTSKGEENAWLKGNKELEEITTEPSTHSTLPGSTIPVRKHNSRDHGKCPKYRENQRFIY